MWKTPSERRAYKRVYHPSIPMIFRGVWAAWKLGRLQELIRDNLR